MDHHETYKKQAEEYEQLIVREDYQNNLRPALERIVDFRGKHIVELGAGTGRLTRLFAHDARSYLALDLAPHMLLYNRSVLSKNGDGDCPMAVADNRCLPVRSGQAEIVISGWSVCYLADWYRDTWRTELDKALSEINSVVNIGGTIILVETLGTGFETPHPPDLLHPYYEVLGKMGFQSSWLRTDYQFESVEEAGRLTRFFFGDELADRLEKNRQTILPECTGIWWKVK